jgi:hypothetical protein
MHALVAPASRLDSLVTQRNPCLCLGRDWVPLFLAYSAAKTADGISVSRGKVGLAPARQRPAALAANDDERVEEGEIAEDEGEEDEDDDEDAGEEEGDENVGGGMQPEIAAVAAPGTPGGGGGPDERGREGRRRSDTWVSVRAWRGVLRDWLAVSELGSHALSIGVVGWPWGSLPG